MKKFIIETEGDFDEYSILDALTDFFPKDDFKVTEVKEFTFESCDFCKYISCHLSRGATYCMLYGLRIDNKACESFIPDSEISCENISDCTEDEVNCAECSSVSVKETVTKQIELVEE